MGLTIFARFHARPGRAGAVATALREVLGPSRAEAGCIAIEACRSIQDADLFFVHSHWIDEAAFEVHAALPHTRLFLATVQALIDHPLEVARTKPL